MVDSVKVRGRRLEEVAVGIARHFWRWRGSHDEDLWQEVRRCRCWWLLRACHHRVVPTTTHSLPARGFETRPFDVRLHDRAVKLIHKHVDSQNAQEVFNACEEMKHRSTVTLQHPAGRASCLVEDMRQSAVESSPTPPWRDDFGEGHGDRALRVEGVYEKGSKALRPMRSCATHGRLHQDKCRLRGASLIHLHDAAAEVCMSNWTSHVGMFCNVQHVELSCRRRRRDRNMGSLVQPIMDPPRLLQGGVSEGSCCPFFLQTVFQTLLLVRSVTGSSAGCSNYVGVGGRVSSTLHARWVCLGAAAPACSSVVHINNVSGGRWVVKW